MITRGSRAAGAVFSDCEKYRYSLWRCWSERADARFVNFLMLNPSTATEEVLDPTIKRCVQFSKDWGYEGIIVTNLFALRSTDPKQLYKVADPTGPENDAVILEVAGRSALAICAWSQHAKYRNRGANVRSALLSAGIKLHYLRMGAKNNPHHPLYLPGDLKPTEWL
jgi:hypothetical protein